MCAAPDRQIHQDTVLARTVDALDASDVTWCLLRGSTRSVDDVDLLVAASHLPRVSSALRRLGYLMIPSWGRGSHRAFVAYDLERDEWIKLDVATELDFGRHFALQTNAASGVLARRVRREGWWVPNTDDRFWALLLHCLADREAIPLKYRDELAEMISVADERGDLATWLAEHMPPGWGPKRILDQVRAGNWQELERAGALSFGRRRTHGLGATWRLLRGSILRRSTKLLTLLHRRGLGIAILGPDGAGKSTLARGLEESFFLPIRTVYMGLYGDTERSRLSMGLPGRLIGLWSRWVRGAYHRARGRLVIYDRYAYDALLPMGRSASLRRRVRRWVIAHTCPAPDLTVVLDAPGAVLFDRAREHDPEALERQRQGYLELRNRIGGVVVVDGTVGQSDLRRKVTALIWDRYVERSPPR
jgi:thymidylate kinase